MIKKSKELVIASAIEPKVHSALINLEFSKIGKYASIKISYLDNDKNILKYSEALGASVTNIFSSMNLDDNVKLQDVKQYVKKLTDRFRCRLDIIDAHQAPWIESWIVENLMIFKHL